MNDLRSDNTTLPLISIIVPIYNIEQYVPSCIDSILRQTYENLEILLIDDGSTDRSGIICDTYCQKDIRCKVIHQQNQGYTCARNTGLQCCTGEYIAFIDGDDSVHPQYIEILYKELDQGGDCGFSMCLCRRVIYKDGGVCDEIDPSYKKTVLSQERLMQSLFGRNVKYERSITFWTVWGKLYRREMLTGLYFINTASEDTEFNTRLYLRVSQAIYIYAKLYYWTQRPTSVTHSAFSSYHIGLINSSLISLNDIPVELQKYRSLCLERLYKVMLSTRYNAPSSFKHEAKDACRHAVRRTLNEFLCSKHISWVYKLTTLLFYYVPVSYVFFRYIMARRAKI